ncbi:unnamed protein product [Dovyalis caffra]|uniref:Uncharacterized protein n=1 Tax=Dovyalis caffra TaxID=77055 RepID=A0AAV1RZ35_9ROSI|nr:unnamed protein product [Dovyalis caffra]
MVLASGRGLVGRGGACLLHAGSPSRVARERKEGFVALSSARGLAGHGVACPLHAGSPNGAARERRGGPLALVVVESRLDE